MYCGDVPDHIVEEGIDSIIKDLEFKINQIKYDGYSNLLYDYLSCDPYKENKANLEIEIIK